jgi:hypothetical protein
VKKLNFPNILCNPIAEAEATAEGKYGKLIINHHHKSFSASIKRKSPSGWIKKRRIKIL